MTIRFSWESADTGVQQLKSIEHDPRLNERDKKKISARIKANRERHANSISLSSVTPMQEGSDSDWNEYVASINAKLRCLKQELGRLNREHESKLCSEVETELGLSKAQVDSAHKAFLEAEDARNHELDINQHIERGREAFVAEHTRPQREAHDAAVQAYSAEVWKLPIPLLAQKLQNVPGEYIEIMLDRVLAMEATDPHVLNEEVHRFLGKNHHRLSGVAAPIVVAHIGRLVAESQENSGARELLDRLSVDNRTEVAGLVAYLRYVISEPPELRNGGGMKSSALWA